MQVLQAESQTPDPLETKVLFCTRSEHLQSWHCDACVVLSVGGDLGDSVGEAVGVEVAGEAVGAVEHCRC
jgi:hypothetical protein